MAIVKDTCPITRPALRRLKARAVLVTDTSGITRFDGDLEALELQAKAYKAKGPATWSYETRTGTQLPWPNMVDVSDFYAPPASGAADDKALYLAERTSELLARAYRDAYSQAGALMGETLGAMQSAVNALSNRLGVQEELIETLLRQRAENATSAPSEADKLVGQVLELATQQQKKG